MYKSILVHLTGTETDNPALAVAISIARPHGAHLNCLRVRMNAGSMIAMASGVSMAPGLAVAETFSILRDQDVRLTEQARKTFNAVCPTEGIKECSTPGMHGITAAWIERSGGEVDETMAAGRFHDLVIVSRKSAGHIGFSPYDLGTLTLSCGRPVLIVPAVAFIPTARKVAIAWKNTAEAARAISAAMPLIAGAHHVVLLSANEDDDRAAECIDCAEKMAESIRWQNACVEVQYLVPGGRNVPNTILEGASEAGADLLVTGAYGHSRLRETVFGGFTQRVLDGATIPILLFH
jgi:nucleotide-binding universal stress UspA family protein